MDNPLLTSIVLFASNFEPSGWMKCDGRQLQISQYPALFSLFGNRFGGDGVRIFALPKLDAPAGMMYITPIAGMYPMRD